MNTKTKIIKTIVVDDEPLARRGLRARLDGHSDIEVVAECQNGVDAVSKISQLRPDLVFLDIQMPGLNGFQVIQKLKELKQPIPVIVFVTAYDSYAIKAFDVHALDYLLKPADNERLTSSLKKVREYFANQYHDAQSQKLVNLVSELTGDDCEEILRKLAKGEKIETDPYPDILAIKDGSEVTRVAVNDIQWIDAAGDYMCVHALDGMHIMRKTMKELEQELNPKTFVRVHRSAIANIRYVKKLVSHISGEYHLILQNDTELKVSRSHRDKVKAAMKT
ncbi:LytR/AlgR family response regulator transcription factor [Alteromonas sp. ASW11-130]|uniref:LytR/AlgR family response regulator transcription factor n=1 Tax=Alteromonas sp. ASW11-130 TaxID=3015775 RepID=UPI002242262D|nr:LytTR family DNA-binding domain-containing protein [Alteromonas sp. ASW11-130]MCW8092230.1 LytTR family DNA-binding domain-containing protein [Alteromonas sp. ASW11-130]